MAENGSDLNGDEGDEHSDLDGDFDSPAQLLPPPVASYPDKASLMTAVQTHGREHGYNVVVKTSSVPTTKKPGRAAKVWLRCDRGGTYRPRNGLTEASRKRRRTSRLIDCPFLVVGNGSSGLWKVEVIEPQHNHGPRTDKQHDPPPYRLKRGQISARPYDWPHDASLSPFTTALVVIDMQKDFCSPGGYLHSQGFDLSATQSLIPRLQDVLHSFREAGFPVYHTREGRSAHAPDLRFMLTEAGHRSDLSTLSSRERFRSFNNSAGLGIGSQGPLGRLLIRGEPGHDIVPELTPLDGEPIIDKPGRGAFAHTDFDLLLRVRGIRNLVLAGVTTDVCVSSTMREANDRGYDCLVLEDGTAAGQLGLHASTCESVRMEGGIFGTTTRIDDVIKALDHIRTTNTVNSAIKIEDDVGTESVPPSPTSSASFLPATLSMCMAPSTQMMTSMIAPPSQTLSSFARASSGKHDLEIH